MEKQGREPHVRRGTGAPRSTGKIDKITTKNFRKKHTGIGDIWSLRRRKKFRRLRNFNILRVFIIFLLQS